MIPRILAQFGQSPLGQTVPLGAGINFDPTISFGAVMTFLLVTATVLAAYIRIRVHMARTELMVGQMWRFIYGDGQDEPGIEAKIGHVVRGAMNAEFLRQVRRRGDRYDG